MKFEELFEKYQALLIENDNLKEEIRRLKAKPGLEEAVLDVQEYQAVFDFSSSNIPKFGMIEQEPSGESSCSGINNFSNPMDKIRLYMSLFIGRDDVYAKR